MLLRSLAVALVALAPFGAALANEVQFHVCAAGQNLGAAYARTQYFNGLLGPDQSADVARNLANAAAHIAGAEAGVQQPFSTSPDRRRSISELQGKLAAYARNAEGRSPEARMSMIQGFYTHYLNALAIAYVSSRPDAFRWTSTCDSAMLETNWHLGRAGTYAAVRFEGGRLEEGQARSAQGGANGSAFQAIRKGLSLAMDGVSPPPLVACFFNTEAAWSIVPMLSPSEPHATYVDLLPKVLEVCRGAGGAAQAAHLAVPNVVGLALAEAKRRLADAGLRVRLAPGSPAASPGANGTVEDQSPAAGSQATRDAEVRLVVHSPYVPPSAPPGVPPPAPAAVAPAGPVTNYNLVGSYSKGMLRVTVENGRYVGRTYAPYDVAGTILFDVVMAPEEIWYYRRLFSGYRGRCLDKTGGRSVHADCYVGATYWVLPPRPLEIHWWVVENGELRQINAQHIHDTLVYPHATLGTVPP